MLQKNIDKRDLYLLINRTYIKIQFYIIKIIVRDYVAYE